jgi:quercetin dioxygenase-like cupin family protein
MDLREQILKVKELVSYQTGAVVSRTLIKKPTGTVTIFAFDQGEELSEHTAPFDALVLVLEGKAEIIIAGQSHILSADELIIMPANKPHAVKAPEKFKMALILIK